MKLYAIVVATERQGYYDALVEGCRRNKIEMVVLGQGQKWRGFAWRFNLIRNHLKKLRQDDVVVCLDAYDMLATQHASVVLERFKSFGSPIVISVDSPVPDSISAYYRVRLFGKCPKADPCGGAYMGRVGALHALYSYICKEFRCDDAGFDKLDDQRILTEVCCKDDPISQSIQYDYESRIFYNLPVPKSELKILTAENIFQPDERHQVKEGRLYLRETGVSPCFIHGLVNANMDVLTDLYQLPGRKNPRKYYILHTLKHQCQFFKLELTDILLTILTIVLLIVLLLRNKTKIQKTPRNAPTPRLKKRNK
jgi:hypothetical protein